MSGFYRHKQLTLADIMPGSQSRYQRRSLIFTKIDVGLRIKMTGVVKHLQRFAVAILFLVIWYSPDRVCHAQNSFDDPSRAAFIFDIARYVTWPDEPDIDTMKFAVMGHDSLLAYELRKLSSHVLVHQKPVRILIFRDYDDIRPAQVLFLNKESNLDIDKVLRSISGKGTLLISENYEYHKSMINFIMTDGKKRFEVNEDRLYDEGISVTPAFLALSVKTPSDWEGMYEKTEQALQKEKMIVEEQLAVIEKQKKEIEQKVQEVLRMNAEIMDKQQHIDQQGKDIQLQKSRLVALITDISQQQKTLRQKTLVLDSQNREIIAQKEILKTQVAEIAAQEEKINEQKSAMVQQLEKIHIQRIALALFISLLFVIIILGYFIWRAYRIKKLAHRELEVKNRLIVEQHDALELEKNKSDRLLRNILPVRVADDLKARGRTDPQVFHNVTVLFTDIVGFTKVSSGYGPQRLIDELNELFTAFDNIMEANGCERIKTIGDAYLAVCGMPEENPRHAECMLNAAFDLLNYLNERNLSSEIKWKVRTGLHSGEVVGGVVGIKKYIYDVFGDTINTASRMESLSEPMMVNISETTYGLVQHRFTFEKRESLQVKGKGMMDMYFCTGKI